MTQEIYQKAIKFAGEKHKNQQVPGTNSNYLLHISNVAMEILMAYAAANTFDLDFAVQLAILHDTLEDTDTKLEELSEAFGDRVAKGVLALTKNEQLSTKQEQMMDSLNRINQLEKEVGMVKLADRITNLQEPPGHWTKDKMLAYRKEALMICEELFDKNEYLHRRLEQKIEDYQVYLK
ncbi:HD domain-containing protein [Marinifilum caeruleilacunae]|uniref:Bifunctional (P)ppGpp synthetase/guanosine-3',5'-bis(Diphosphate) 3'-pyrophosphohydrolase n=1 Tax=Marinifilum caeruleilacunae TaxID=2499076 RepID=A0ABX1WVQ0_9BACT|nr:HD domain-containing protein [Marinifilum caeruleilacunae]NOU60162.1 bifunctional (p)ppGpp synthetase/guanosine-3',5'-bis(diphosphate) 3'-pyrophosphohydrolase [Marinifilum caeruleilacunae]